MALALTWMAQPLPLMTLPRMALAQSWELADAVVHTCKLLKPVYTLQLIMLMACSQQRITMLDSAVHQTIQGMLLRWLLVVVPNSISKSMPCIV